MAKIKDAGTVSVKKDLKDSPIVVANMRTAEYAAPKTSGIKMRGGGAAKRGVTSRGPMA